MRHAGFAAGRETRTDLVCAAFLLLLCVSEADASLLRCNGNNDLGGATAYSDAAVTTTAGPRRALRQGPAPSNSSNVQPVNSNASCHGASCPAIILVLITLGLLSSSIVAACAVTRCRPCKHIVWHWRHRNDPPDPPRDRPRRGRFGLPTAGDPEEAAEEISKVVAIDLQRAESSDCPVCLTAEEAWARLPCGHGMCRACLAQLVKAQAMLTMCPLCRAPILPDWRPADAETADSGETDADTAAAASAPAELEMSAASPPAGGAATPPRRSLSAVLGINLGRGTMGSRSGSGVLGSHHGGSLALSRNASLDMSRAASARIAGSSPASRNGSGVLQQPDSLAAARALMAASRRLPLSPPTLPPPAEGATLRVSEDALAVQQAENPLPAQYQPAQMALPPHVGDSMQPPQEPDVASPPPAAPSLMAVSPFAAVQSGPLRAHFQDGEAQLTPR